MSECPEGAMCTVLEPAMAAYGRELGVAFQVADDVLDYMADVDMLGKNSGDDLAEGKPTLPLIRAMQAGSEAQRERVRRAILEGGREDFAPVLEVIRATDALAYARDAATRESQTAVRAIDGLPPSAYRDSLLELAAFSVSRRG